jgi:ATP-binding cassette subfamily F protein uup
VTLNVLERLLLGFDGSVLLVTHDRYFLDKVATAVLAFEGDGRAVRYPGNYETYRTLKDQAGRALAAERAPAPAPRGTTAAPAAPAPARARRPGKLAFQEQRELDGMEAAILEVEARKAVLEAALSDPATYQRDGAAVAGMRIELEAATAEIERLYARWQELEAIRAGG